MLTNAVITWSTDYYALAVGRLRGAGRNIPDELLAHISPAHSENVNFFGTITVDVEAELAGSRLSSQNGPFCEPARCSRCSIESGTGLGAHFEHFTTALSVRRSRHDSPDKHVR